LPDKDPARIRAMFDAIAPRYDLLNHLLSAGRDRVWRRRTADRVVSTAPSGPILDLACGTGDLLLELMSAARTDRRLMGADFSGQMLTLCAAKMEGADRSAPLLQSDGRRLPFPDASLAGVTIAFGLRNFPDAAAGIDEMQRVLVPGGMLGILEFTNDRTRWFDLVYQPWSRLIIPLLGRIVAGRGGAAYSYLPESVADYVTSSEMWGIIQRCGLEPVEERSFTGGVCRLFLARRPA